MRPNPLAAINAVAVAIGRFSSVQDMLEYALDQVLDVVRTEAGCVYLLDEEREELDLVAHRGLPDALMRDIDRLKLGVGLSGRVALTGDPIVIRSLKDDPRLIHQAARDEGLRGFASVPLRSNFKTYGTLNIHTHADRVFSEEDVQLLTSMASQIGLAVANTRLYMNLEASERKFRGLVENADDLVYLTDLSGRILYVNPALERLLGHDPASFCSSDRTTVSLIHPDDRELVASTLPAMLSGRPVRALQFRMTHADGVTVRWFSQTSVPLRDQAGRLTGTQCIAHDITEQREMQEQMAGAERLADLGRMAATIAHEIRNPLGAIVNSINALRHPRIAGDRRLLDIITEETARLDGIVNDFLMFARPPRCVPLVCDIPDLIDTTVFLFKRSGRAGDRIELRCACDSSLPQALADSNQLRQVLWNLLSNAVDATIGGGAIDIEAYAAPDGRAVWVSVTDDGPGVGDPAQIFEPFYTTKARGTGLGLAVVGRIVSDHGGSIRVERVERRGARISFSLPAAAACGRPVADTA